LTEDIYASNQHARISRDDVGLFVEDMASTNGTYVNAERISTPTRIGKGDLIQVGEMILEVTK
jgi:pSer/pThr/pTyr-binding forkhead associated (FHA) protein